MPFEIISSVSIFRTSFYTVVGKGVVLKLKTKKYGDIIIWIFILFCYILVYFIIFFKKDENASLKLFKILSIINTHLYNH